MEKDFINLRSLRLPKNYFVIAIQSKSYFLNTFKI